MFELLAGDSIPELAAAITSQEPRPASQVQRDGVPAFPAGDLDAILARAGRVTTLLVETLSSADPYSL